jgi:hypothetical protein
MKNSIDNKIEEKNLFGGLLAKSVLNIVEEGLICSSPSQKKIRNNKGINISYSAPAKKESKVDYLELYIRGITGLIKNTYFTN